MGRTSPNREHQQVLLQRLLKLLNVKLAYTEGTTKLRGVRHDKLCEAFEYWIDQTKTLFGEVVLIEKLQSLQDAGVDVAINFPQSKFRIGVQVKSWGDIRKRDFSTKVLAQKSQSKKHDISNLLLALAGDLIDESQLQKMNFIKSEMLQHRDDFVFIISPQKVLTIYNIYTAREHPLKHVMLEIQDAFFLIEGIKESLTNERRQVNIELNVNYIHDREDEKERPHRLALKSTGGKNHARFPDDVEYLPMTDDTIRLGDENDSLSTVGSDGKILSPSEILIWAEKQNRIGMILHTISHEGSPIQALQQVFDIETRENVVYFKALDTKQPLMLNIQYSSNTLKFGFVLDHINYDVYHVLKSITFMQSLSNAAILRGFDITNNKKIFDLPCEGSQIVPQQLVVFYHVLHRLEKQTGYKMKFSKADSQDDLSSKLREAVGLLSIVESKYIGSTYLNLRIELPVKLMRKFLQDFESRNIKGDAYRKLKWFSYYFLGNHLRVKNVIINLGKLEPKNTQEALKEMGFSSGTEVTEIEFKGIH